MTTRKNYPAQMKQAESSSSSNRTHSYGMWFLFAVVTRILASMTHSHWFHPDEWCQTFEPANIIAHGFGVHSQEIGLHMRNLTWPMLLAGVLKMSHAWAPSSIDLRVFGTNLLAGLLDLLIFWGWAQLLKQDPVARSFSPRLKSWSFGLLLLPWFSIYEAVSPRAEHLSEIAFWATLGCVAHSYWVLAGLASVAIAAFRYPSALLSVTIAGFVIWKSFFEKSKTRSPFSFQTGLRFIAGVFLGILVFGAADAVIYGRPWESFWMYLQYNLFTGTGTQVFGAQGIQEYIELFAWDWRTYPVLFPMGVTLGLACIYGFYSGIVKARLWALCLAVYLLGHFLVPHKEGRFMIPVETLLLWSAFLGMGTLGQTRLYRKVAVKPLLKFALVVTLIANGLIFLHALRADLWKEHGTYRELGSHLKATPGVCAILAAGELSSIMMPFVDQPSPEHPLRGTTPELMDSHSPPSPAFGILSLEKDRQGYSALRNSEITWVEHRPSCSESMSKTSGPQPRVLLHTHRIDSGWLDEGCSLSPSGVLRFFPPSLQESILQQGYKASTWYVCPTSIFHYFGEEKVHQIYTHRFNRIPSLPGFGTTARELEELGHQTSPPPQDIFLPTLDNPNALPPVPKK